jgi:2-keto-4-pentenoate hydratase
MKRSFGKTIFAVTVFALALLLALGAGGVRAADVGVELAEQFLKKIPIKTFDAKMTLGEAAKAQEQFIGVISKEFGGPIGYKAGLTNPNVQKAFGVSQPVRGTLLQKMILKSGSVVPGDFGAVPVAEGDLIVRVGSDGINQAKSPGEILQFLDAVIPFLELPDMVFEKGVKLTGAAIVAINVGARYGILGDPIPLVPTQEWQERLKNFTLQALDEKGGVVAEGKGTALLGDPLNAALWLKDSLIKEGKVLKKGDLLSLGSITRPIPVKPGMALRVKYIGLDPKGPVEISVSFR